eukprot:1201298-Lingulodinium_polyedra.AAC.1
MAGHWSEGGVQAWQRVNGIGWQSRESRRGGWQGSRATMVAYACDAEEAFEEAFGGLGSKESIARVGIMDDFYLVADAAV